MAWLRDNYASMQSVNLRSKTVPRRSTGFKYFGVVMNLRFWVITICFHVACVGFSYQEEQADNSEGRLDGLLELLRLPRSSSDWGVPGNPDDDPRLAKGN